MMQRGGGVQEIVVWYVHVIHIHNAAHSQPGDARFGACVIKLFCQGNYSNIHARGQSGPDDAIWEACAKKFSVRSIN